MNAIFKKMLLNIFSDLKNLSVNYNERCTKEALEKTEKNRKEYVDKYVKEVAENKCLSSVYTFFFSHIATLHTSKDFYEMYFDASTKLLDSYVQSEELTKKEINYFNTDIRLLHEKVELLEETSNERSFFEAITEFILELILSLEEGKAQMKKAV